MIRKLIFPRHPMKHVFNLLRYAVVVGAIYIFCVLLIDTLEKRIIRRLKTLKDQNGGVYIADQRSGDRHFTNRPTMHTANLNDRADVVSNICTSQKKLKPNANVLSYCIYGNKKVGNKHIYYDGLPKVIRNVRKSKLFHTWQIRIYHDGQLSPQEINQYEKIDANVHFCDARHLPRYGNLTNIFQMFWRFAPLADPSVDTFCSRDLDSGLLTREEDAVGEFMSSDKVLHSMRDHRQHQMGILGGMWCLKVNSNRTRSRMFYEEILKRAKKSTWKQDQPLLNRIIWYHYYTFERHVILQHDSYWCNFYKGTKPFPRRREENNRYIGCPGFKCHAKIQPCPVSCRPVYGQNWTYC